VIADLTRSVGGCSGIGKGVALVLLGSAQMDHSAMDVCAAAEWNAGRGIGTGSAWFAASRYLRV